MSESGDIAGALAILDRTFPRAGYRAKYAADPATWRGPILARAGLAPTVAWTPDAAVSSTASRPVPVRTPPPPPIPPDGRVRVGFLTPGLHTGGAEWWMYWLATGLDESRYRLEGVAVLDDVPADGPMAGRFAAVMPVWLGAGAVAELWTHVDLMIIWGVPSAAQRQDLKGPGARSVVVAHGVGDWTRESMEGSRHADAVACVSEGGSATVPADQRHRAVVLPNGVDPGRVEAKVGRAEQRSRWGVPPSAPLIGNVARISPEKGTAAFVEALACLPPDWHGVWVGPTNGVEEARDAMARLPDRLGVAGRLHLPGPTEDVGSALGAIDVFLTPSLEDAHPLGSIEAMMAGVPIVTSATGMAVERPDLFRVVRRGATGAELARAVLADAGDVDGTSRRVASARSHALAHYSRSAFLARWAALFDGLGLRAPKAGKAAPPSPWDRLDHAGRERVRLCPLRKEEWDGCCPLDRCHGPKSPHRGRRVQSIDCIECVLADGDR